MMIENILCLLLDASRMGSIMELAKGINSEFESLYRGRSEETMESVAPYLFIFNHHSEFVQWFFENAWGVMVSSTVESEILSTEYAILDKGVVKKNR